MSKRHPMLSSTSRVDARSLPHLEQTAMSQHRDLDATKRDRFELLSAYLDGEVTPEERRLVMFWLDEDPEAQCLYQRLLQLRHGFQGLTQEHWQTRHGPGVANQVIRKINHRFRMTCMAGMTAAAVAVIGVFSGALHPIERMASSGSDSSLEIALDQPPIMIPKPAMAPTPLPMDSALPEASSSNRFGETRL